MKRLICLVMVLAFGGQLYAGSFGNSTLNATYDCSDYVEIVNSNDVTLKDPASGTNARAQKSWTSVLNAHVWPWTRTKSSLGTYATQVSKFVGTNTNDSFMKVCKAGLDIKMDGEVANDPDCEYTGASATKAYTENVFGAGVGDTYDPKVTFQLKCNQTVGKGTHSVDGLHLRASYKVGDVTEFFVDAIYDEVENEWVITRKYRVGLVLIDDVITEQGLDLNVSYDSYMSPQQTDATMTCKALAENTQVGFSGNKNYGPTETDARLEMSAAAIAVPNH